MHSAKSVIYLCLFLFCPCRSFAWQSQSEGTQAELTALRQEVQEMRKNMDGLQAKLEAWEQKQFKTPAPLAAPVPAEKPPVPLLPPTVTQVSTTLQKRETAAGNSYSVARLGNAPIDPSLRGFFRLGETETIMRVGGYAKTDFMYDLRPAGNPDEFAPSTFPTEEVTPARNANLSFRQTRFSLELRRPVLDQALRIYLEGDFFGVNSTSFAIRHAFGQWKDVLLGQTWSLFDDPDASPDTLDFQGPVNMSFVSQPQLRYTRVISGHGSVSVSVEKPFSDIPKVIPDGQKTTPTSNLPDFGLVYRYENSNFHYRASAIFRSVGGFVHSGDQEHVTGYGVKLSGVQRLGGQDNLVFEASIGRGIARYLNDTSGLGLDANLNSTNQLKALPAGGAQVALQHYWLPRLRSSAVYGFAQVNNTSQATTGTYHRSDYIVGNLIYTPLPSVLFGAELIYGAVERTGLSQVNAPRIQLGAQYDFVK